jgi:hypothetical protein
MGIVVWIARQSSKYATANNHFLPPCLFINLGFVPQIGEKQAGLTV